MASSPKLTSLFLLTFLFIIQIHARESHFFSKIPNNNGETTQIPNNNGEATQIPNKFEPLTNTEKTQEPNFIPQTQDTGYGLYGHESGQLPPSDEKYDNDRANDAVSFKTESGEYYNGNDNNDNNDDDNNNFNNNNNAFQYRNTKKPYENSFYYNKDLYDNGRQSFPNARLSRNDYPTDNGRDGYNGDRRDNGNNVVRQGMSDTRFMENGKYYYDLHKEPHHYRNSRGNFGNNNNYNNNNNNNPNSYEYEWYPNDEAEFQDQPDQFLP